MAFLRAQRLERPLFVARVGTHDQFGCRVKPFRIELRVNANGRKRGWAFVQQFAIYTERVSWIWFDVRTDIRRFKLQRARIQQFWRAWFRWIRHTRIRGFWFSRPRFRLAIWVLVVRLGVGLGLELGIGIRMGLAVGLGNRLAVRVEHWDPYWYNPFWSWTGLRSKLRRRIRWRIR